MGRNCFLFGLCTKISSFDNRQRLTNPDLSTFSSLLLFDHLRRRCSPHRVRILRRREIAHTYIYDLASSYCKQRAHLPSRSRFLLAKSNGNKSKDIK
ncbi:hypothetical protein AXX17_AT5G64060 [Arabidopsis thaliana]|uniref:Uncharacterized protein n=1 Tax=Arabidopsis thaliana TaxID=3702 RepID=A0A178UPW3_ARATH|nr:hypothetical protein AXX17_AT5G64060 [Arabidopsis thaliana]